MGTRWLRRSDDLNCRAKEPNMCASVTLGQGAWAVCRLDARVSVSSLSLQSLRAPAELTSVLNLCWHQVAGPPIYRIHLLTTTKDWCFTGQQLESRPHRYVRIGEHSHFDGSAHAKFPFQATVMCQQTLGTIMTDLTPAAPNNVLIRHLPLARRVVCKATALTLQSQLVWLQRYVQNSLCKATLHNFTIAFQHFTARTSLQPQGIRG